jgi:hypothetical protein
VPPARENRPPPETPSRRRHTCQEAKLDTKSNECLHRESDDARRTKISSEPSDSAAFSQSSWLLIPSRGKSAATFLHPRRSIRRRGEDPLSRGLREHNLVSQLGQAAPPPASRILSPPLVKRGNAVSRSSQSTVRLMKPLEVPVYVGLERLAHQVAPRVARRPRRGLPGARARSSGAPVVSSCDAANPGRLAPWPGRRCA